MSTAVRRTAQQAIVKALSAIGLDHRRHYVIQYAMREGQVTHLYLTIRYQVVRDRVHKYRHLIERVTSDLGQPWQVRYVLERGARRLEVDNRAD